ncbi:hypothetical protein EJB05_49114, partial [Eragrostis curvula]
MAQLDDAAIPQAQTSHAVVIDIDDGCAVCTEPLEWVAVGECGHRDVCFGCAARLRFFQDDRRCCICRAQCPDVVVTRARGGGGGASPPCGQPEARFLGFQPLAGAPGPPGRCYYWYHAGIAAFFDDWRPYKMARDHLCVRPTPPPPSSPASTSSGSVVVNLDNAPSQQPAAAAGANVNPGAADDERGLLVATIVLYLGALATLLICSGLAFVGLAEHWYQKVLVVLACALAAAGLTALMISGWRHRCRTRPSRNA